MPSEPGYIGSSLKLYTFVMQEYTPQQELLELDPLQYT